MDSNGKHCNFDKYLSSRQTEIDFYVDIQWSNPPTRRATQQCAQCVLESFSHSLPAADVTNNELQIFYVQIRYTFNVGSEDSWTWRKLKL